MNMRREEVRDGDIEMDEVYEEDGRVDRVRRRLNPIVNETETLLQSREICLPMREKRHHLYQRPVLSVLQRLTSTAEFVKLNQSGLFEDISLWGKPIHVVEGKFGSGIGSYFRFHRRLFGLNLVLFFISFGIIICPHLVFELTIGSSSNDKSNFNVLDLLTGEGYLNDTPLFYGHYNENVTFSNGMVFRTSYSYFYATLALYVLSIVFISVSMSKLYRNNVINVEVREDSQFYLANKVFGGWNGEIHDEEEMKFRKEKLLSQIQESLEKVKKNRPTHRKSRNYIGVRIIVNGLVFGILVGAGFLTSMTIDAIEENKTWSASLNRLLLSFSVTLALYVIPIIFRSLTKLESYEITRTAAYINLTRTILLEKIFLTTIFLKDLGKVGGKEVTCWENFIGQSMYRLVVASLIVLVFGTFIFECGHRMLHSKFKIIPPPEFDIAKNSTNLIFVQSVAFIGYYFVPGMAFLMVPYFVITFYVKLIGLRINCSKSKTAWRAAQSQTVFMVYTFLSTLASILAYIYVIKEISPSKECGPFVNYKYVYEIIAKEDFLKSIFLFKPAFIAVVIVLLTVGIYYTSSLNRAYIIEAKKLREKIINEKIERRILNGFLTNLNEQEIIDCRNFDY